MNEKIKYLIIGFLFGIFAYWICSRFAFGGITGSKELDSAIRSTKQEFDGHNSAAKDTNSRIANYNRQLECGCKDLDGTLREAEKRIDNAIKIRTQETKSKQIKG